MGMKLDDKISQVVLVNLDEEYGIHFSQLMRRIVLAWGSRNTGAFRERLRMLIDAGVVEENLPDFYRLTSNAYELIREINPELSEYLETSRGTFRNN